MFTRKGGELLLLKEVVVEYLSILDDGKEYCVSSIFKAKRDYLTVLNKEDGLLVVNDVQTDPLEVDTIAIFNKGNWVNWRAIKKKKKNEYYDDDSTSLLTSTV